MAEATIAPFDWADPFDLSDQLSDEERMVRDTAEAYAQEKLQPRVTEAYLEERAKRGSRAKYEAALAQVPDVEPEPYDRLPQS